MKRNLKFFTILFWILFSRTYDAFCTFKHTPDLSKEANPLVTLFGFDWFWLLFVIGLLTLYTCYTLYLISFKPINLYPKKKEYSFSNFIAYMYFGKESNLLSILYKFPKINERRFHYTFGNIFVRFLVYAGVISTTMWMLINNSELYKDFHNPYFIYSILIVGIVIIMFFYYKKHYIKYKLNKKDL